jgi:hypothetical protein
VSRAQAPPGWWAAVSRAAAPAPGGDRAPAAPGG